ncbi:hypothetical protein D3C72_1677000 [compost metagenome]
MQRIQQMQRISGHVAQAIGSRHRQAEAIAHDFVRQVRRGHGAGPGGQPDVAVIEADHPEAALAEPFHHLVRPMDQLPTQAHDQQQRRVPLPPHALVRKAHLAQVDGFRRRGHIAAGESEGRQAADERGEQDQHTHVGNPERKTPVERDSDEFQ